MTDKINGIIVMAQWTHLHVTLSYIYAVCYNTSSLMAERPKHQLSFHFKNIRLLKDQSLGIGSYGAVCKAICDDLLCAAKIIHPTLFDLTAHQLLPQKEHRLPIRRFEQECDFMSAIRHPNIVQYLGLYRDTDTHLPVLLMDLMDDSLTHFLESSTQAIPYHIQVNICHDITLATSFLHSNNIVHRDLSSNNVLLIGNARAKISDFGMASLGDTNSSFTNTMCPGTDVYMPPEAVQDKPVYTEKIDCFSIGVIMVQIMTRLFPKPGDRLKELEFHHPGLPPGKILVQVPEIRRRHNHISQVNSDNPLLPVTLNCLKDKDSERPSAHQLCERISDLKGMPKYLESTRSMQDKDTIIKSLTTRVKEADQACSQLEKRVRHLRQQREQVYRQFEESQERVRQLLQQKNDEDVRDNRVQLASVSKEREPAHANQQLKPNEQVVAKLKEQISDFVQKMQQQNPKASSREKEPTSFKLRWREGKRAPFKMSRWCDAATDGNTVYVRGGGSVTTYSYDIISDRWSKLADCVYDNGSITIIEGWLTNIGGYSYSHYSNELFSLTKKGRWTKKFPPMPTKRMCTIAVCIEAMLVVAGGWGESGVLSTVEVLNTENLQWSNVADLPQPMYCASATVCGDQLYVLGGRNKDYTDAKSVHTCLVSALLQSCIWKSLEADAEKASDVEWKQVADLPFKQSTCVSWHGKLLAIGGLDVRKCTTAVSMYKATTNSWEIISHLKTGRYDCFTALLNNNQLMVVGGFTDSFSTTDTIEVSM